MNALRSGSESEICCIGITSRELLLKYIGEYKVNDKHPTKQYQDPHAIIQNVIQYIMNCL